MKSHSPFYTEREIKSGFDFSPWGGIDGFLRASAAGGSWANQGAVLKRIIPDLSHAVSMTATAVSSLPFDFIDLGSNEVVTASVNLSGIGGIFDDFSRILYLTASSLCGGSAYLLPRKTQKMIIDLQYISPHNVTPFFDANGLAYFNRVMDSGKIDRIEPEEMIYFWLPDSDVEIGPALNTPLGNAVNDASLLLSTVGAMRNYGERGFVPITLLGAKGMIDETERQKAESYFDRLLRGGFNVLAKIFNADSLSIQRVGAGMDDLKGIYTEIRQQSREGVAQAFGIPAALFMADKAFASEVDMLTRQWYTTSVFRSIYQTIEGVLSLQLLKAYGFKMRFDLNRLDIFQEDENQRASSVSSYVSAIQANPKIAGLVMDFMGVDLNDDQKSKLDELIAENQPGDNTGQKNESADLSPEEMKDISLWYSKAVAWFGKGRSAADWSNKHLRESIALPIRQRLATAATLEEVKAAFIVGRPDGEVSYRDEIKQLAESINRAVGR